MTHDSDSLGSSLLQTPTAVRWIIVANVAVYFLQLTVLSAGSVQAGLGFEMRDLDGAWWTVLTYMFVHGGFWHLALNMYMLWLFGPRMEGQFGPGQFTGYYLLCGLGGWFFHLLFAPNGMLIGASAAVMGVMLAYASRWPDEEMLIWGLIPLSVRRLIGLLVIVNIAGGLGVGGSGIAYLAHLGGLAAGWMYLRMAGSMDIERIRQRVATIADEPEGMPPRAFPRSFPKKQAEGDASEIDDIVAQSKAAVAERGVSGSRAADPVHRQAGTPSAELNLLLDKISAHGLESLTKAERKRLEEAARKLGNS